MVFHAEVLILWVVHALDGIHVAKEHVIQPLNGDRGYFPLFGFLILVSFTAVKQTKLDKLTKAN